MKFAIISIAIIILAVVFYAIFAKTTVTNQTGQGTTQTTHNGALGWLKGILDGFSVSVVGK